MSWDVSYYHTIDVGDTLVTAGRTVTEADVGSFAGVSGDDNRLHTDATSMADSTFGERIALGPLVFSMTTGLPWGRRPSEERDAIVAFYGVDSLRFTGHTFVGNTIHVESTVAAKTPADREDAAGIVRYETEVVDQDDETVLYCDPIVLFECACRDGPKRVPSPFPHPKRPPSLQN
ncbi:MaoC/PaaZ C-terminal domain-containing protein [Halanaeroarchaeum sp. HSR-CO]|uniref:MaoC/PaaZ C-terminal domain-containing protein n=1 Tax=Halanaeroarchaeum sp. HSR-CO TaxID=2866382 RepID=UPI0028776D5E|nr:MaoC/PaaZ C-terminal domain-containing protein [Halanaeroarchaeum sp. HSR-CO]